MLQLLVNLATSSVLGQSKSQDIPRKWSAVHALCWLQCTPSILKSTFILVSCQQLIYIFFLNVEEEQKGIIKVS